MTEKVALDSQRSKDDSGHLKVARTVISKAGVNPYYGREIPDYEALGLDPDKVYHLLRDPKELAEAVETFKGKPLLIKHEYVDSEKPEKDLIVGSVGSSLEFVDGTLYGDITVWDAEAIELIESKKLEELSASYWYEPDMSTGKVAGRAYDGIMRNIRGNHVALVARGRIGRDATISDNLPLTMEFPMIKEKAKTAVANKLLAIAKRGIAQDSDAEDVIREVIENIEHKAAFDTEKLRELVGDSEKYSKIVELLGGLTTGDEGKPADDEGESADDEGKPADDTQMQDERDNESEAMRLHDREKREEEDRDRDRREAAMDADSIAASVQAKIEAKYTARDKVEPIVGRVALDGFATAADVYRFALKHAGVACDGVNDAGLEALVAMVSTKSKQTVAADADSFAPSAHTSRFRKA